MSLLLLPFFIFDLPHFVVHLSEFALLSLDPLGFLLYTCGTFLLVLERQGFWFKEAVLYLFPWGWFKGLILDHCSRQLFLRGFTRQPWGPTIFTGCLAGPLVNILVKFLNTFVCPLLVAAAEYLVFNLPWLMCVVHVIQFLFFLWQHWLSQVVIRVVRLLIKPYSQVLDVTANGFSDFMQQVWVNFISVQFDVD